MTPAKVIGYVRVSAEKQLESNSFPEQAKAIQAWAQSNGYELDSIYYDAGVSGAKLKERTGLLGALQRCRKDETVAGICFYDFTRYSRDVAIGAQIKTLVYGAGKKLFSSTEQVDLDTIDGELHFNILQSIAQYQRKSIVKLLYSRRMAKGAAGGWIGGRVPWGKKPQQGELVEDFNERRCVRLIRRLRKWARWTYQAIADYMNALLIADTDMFRQNEMLMSSLSNMTPIQREMALISYSAWAPKSGKPLLKARTRPYKRNKYYCWTIHAIAHILVVSEKVILFENKGRPRKDGPNCTSTPNRKPNQRKSAS